MGQLDVVQDLHLSETASTAALSQLVARELQNEFTHVGILDHKDDKDVDADRRPSKQPVQIAVESETQASHNQRDQKEVIAEPAVCDYEDD